MATSPKAALHIGYFGRAGSFSHVAAARRFPKERLSECPTVEEAFARLQGGNFSHIVVPIENASSGTITNTADQLMRLAKSEAGGALQIREALAMRIELVLMARKDTKVIARILFAPRAVRSQPALAGPALSEGGADSGEQHVGGGDFGGGGGGVGGDRGAAFAEGDGGCGS